MTRRSLRRDRTGSTAVEFALVGMMLCLVTFAILETGVLWWMKTEMQMTASSAARCGAIGYTYGTTNCVSNTTTQAWVLALANNWMFPGQITNASITVNNRAAGTSYCGGAPGNFYSVTITSNWFNFMPPPLGNNANLSVTGCSPVQ